MHRNTPKKVYILKLIFLSIFLHDSIFESCLSDWDYS